jgi:hypothetical protein
MAQFDRLKACLPQGVCNGFGVASRVGQERHRAVLGIADDEGDGAPWIVPTPAWDTLPHGCHDGMDDICC